MNNELIFGVYYIFCENNWKDVFIEQVKAIKESNILSICKKLHVVVASKQIKDFNFIKSNLLDTNIKFYNIQNNTQFEFPALKLLKQICEKHSCKVFYIHTKGTGISEANKTFYHGCTNLKYLQECVRDWRQYMEYFTLYKAAENISLLNEYDACGVNLVEHPHKHYSGNFWWSKSTYINTLPDIDALDVSYRWNAEFWLGYGNGLLFCHYQEPNAGYTNKISKNFKIL
jgi:hypothetical protein